MNRSLSSALVAVLGVIAGDEVVEVAALERVFLEREVQVRAQVVDPELLRPRLFLRGLAVEEQDVRLHALRVEDAGGQAQERVHVRLLEQFAPDGFARAAFKQHVVRQHHRRAAMLLEDGEDVLEEIELLVARARPEIVAVDDERFLGASPASLTMVTLLFLPKGGLARTISYSPCFPASASLVT